MREITIIVYFEQGVGSSRKEERPLKGRALLQNQAQEGNLRGKHNWNFMRFLQIFWFFSSTTTPSGVSCFGVVTESR